MDLILLLLVILKEVIKIEQENPKIQQIKDYLNNLNEGGLKQLSQQLIQYPTSIKDIRACIIEFDKFYKHPLKFREDKK